MRYSIEIEVSDEAIQESGLDAEAYIHQEMGWLEESGFRLVHLQKHEEPLQDVEVAASEKEETLAPEASLTREDFIGKEFYINSTCYYNGELFEAGKSLCNGATADLKRLRFQSNREDGKYMNLGALPTRTSEQVFSTPAAVASFVASRYTQIEGSHKQRLSDDFHSLKDYPLFLVGKNQATDHIYIRHACAYEDEWTGMTTTRVYCGSSPGMEFQAVPFELPFSMRVGNSVNECVLVDSLDDAIKHCVAFMGETVRQFERSSDEKPLSSLMEEAKERTQAGKDHPDPTSPDGENKSRKQQEVDR